MNLNLRQIASKLSPKQWIAVGGATLVGILFVFLLFSLASSPSYTTLVAGVAPSQTGKITSALSTAGINYQLQSNGTAVSVQSSQEAQARVVLDEQGLLVGTGSSSSLESYLGKESLGESQQQQNEQDTSAIEEQLEQQIESMNGIESAQVALAIPDATDNLFSATSTAPTGSVLLSTDDTPSGSSVKAIAELVANAVPGLKSDKVTVTDQDGDLLWPQGSTSGATATSKQAADQAYDDAAAAKADDLLDSTVGAGKALVQVSADLDTNQQKVDSVTYGPKGTPLQSTSTTESLDGTGIDGTDATGDTATEDATDYAGTAGNGKSRYRSKSASVTYGVKKTVSETQISPGTVNRQSISVLLSSGVPRSEIPTIRTAVENAVGYVAKRDSISVGTIPFAKVATTSGSSTTKTALGAVKYVAVGLAALLFLLFMTRMLRRREHETFAGSPTWLRELENPRPLAALEAERQMVDLEQPTVVGRLQPRVNPARQQVEDLVDRDAERVANQVRQWMTED